jgi:hypothetical protein
MTRILERGYIAVTALLYPDLVQRLLAVFVAVGLFIAVGVNADQALAAESATPIAALDSDCMATGQIPHLDIQYEETTSDPDGTLVTPKRVPFLNGCFA